MRILRTIALTGVMLGLAAALVPAQAACGAAQQVTTVTIQTRSYVWTDGWEVYYYAPAAVPATFSGLPPITAEFFSVYWGLGTGNTAYALGDDSGSYVVPPATWTYWWSLADIYPVAAKVFGTWAQNPAIDGCIPTNTCECLLMTDEKDGVGYFAIATALTDAGGNADFTQGGSDPLGWSTPIILRAMPTPTVTRIDLNEDTHVLTFNVNVPAPAGPLEGVYEKDSCSCGPNQYVIYRQTVGVGEAAPTSRDAAQGWEAITPATDMGVGTSFDTSCATDSDLYLAVGMVFDSGFPGGPYKVTLSANEGPYACGPTIADPVELQPKYRYDRREVPRPERKR